MLSLFCPSADINGSCESEMVLSLAFMSSKQKEKPATSAETAALIVDVGADAQRSTSFFEFVRL